MENIIKNFNGIKVFILLFLAIGFILLLWTLLKKGGVEITVQPIDAVISIENKSLQYQGDFSIKLKPGQYKIKANRKGYTSEVQLINIMRGKKTKVNFRLKRENFDQFYLDLPGPPGLKAKKDYEFQNIHYFQDNLWAVAEFVYKNIEANGAVVVFNYRNGKWVEVFSGTALDENVKGNMPQDVYEYLENIL